MSGLGRYVHIPLLVTLAALLIFFRGNLRSQDNTSRDSNSNAHLRRVLGYIPETKGEYTDYSYLVKHIVGTTTRNAPKKLVTRFSELAGSNLLDNREHVAPSAEETSEYIKKAKDSLTWSENDGKIFRDSQAYDSIVHDFIGKGQKQISAMYNNNTMESSTVDISAYLNLDNLRFQDLFDLVTVYDTSMTPEKWTKFLEAWKPIIHEMNIIVIVTGPVRDIAMPAWSVYEIYTQEELANSLHQDAWVFDFEKGKISAISFGLMVADKDYIFILDPETVPFQDKDGSYVNPFHGHLINLRTPSNPYYYNIWSNDPYKAQSDFERGYPYTLREGIPTAVSIGVVLGRQGFDSITSFLKLNDTSDIKDQVNHDIANALRANTIPHGTLFSLSLSNVAINRKLAAPALYIPSTFLRNGLDIGDKNLEVFTGWVLKVVLDHIRAGVKHGGKTYIEDKSFSEGKYANAKTLKDVVVDPFPDMVRDLAWQNVSEEIVRFFASVQLSAKSQLTTSASAAELTDKFQDASRNWHPGFKDYAKAAALFAYTWNRQNAFHPEMLPVTHRTTFSPPADSKHQCAAFTITSNEPEMLPLWIRYYSKHFPGSAFVVRHHFNISNILNDPDEKAAYDSMTELTKKSNVRVWHLYGENHGYPVHFLVASAQVIQQRFLRAGYKCVLYTDVDEFIVPDPKIFPGGLNEYLVNFTSDSTRVFTRALGYNVGHVSESDGKVPALEAPIDWSKSILAQRSYRVRNTRYDKPLLSKIPVRWRPGFHTSFFPPNIPHDVNLYLLHLTDVDKDFCTKREAKKYELIKIAPPDEVGGGFSAHIVHYPSLLRKGMVCKNARAFLSSDGAVRDGAGTGVLEKMGDEWKSVEL